ELADALKYFPRWRYQGLVLKQVAAVYAALRGQLAEELHEVGLCRGQLTAALTAVQARAADPPPEEAGWLLPDGCRTADEAADRLLGGVTRDDLHDLDRRAQA